MEYAVIEAWAKELGFAQVGVCSPRDFSEQKDMVDAQPELRERRQLRFMPETECPWATAILVLLWPYAQARLSDDGDVVFVDSYYTASNQAYQAGKKLEEMLSRAGYRAQANASYPAKAAAVRAGMGVIGDNGLLITRDNGTRVVITLLATDAIMPELEDRTSAGECLHCGKCLSVCPTGAIDCGAMTHPERCLRNHMMEGCVVPEEVRPLMGMRLVGCDMCQRVCPMQNGKEAEPLTAFALDDFMTTDEAAFKAQVAKLSLVIGKNMARPQRVRAQAALLAGNRKKETDLEVLRAWSESDFEAVSEHAKWAVKQIERHMQGIDQYSEKR